ncbi:MAG: DUF6157 family protein [Candidatus Promineifilaceae bacterium]
MDHTTNYYDTFIEVAEDCPVITAEIPTSRKADSKTIAMYQFEMISQHPYEYTSDDVLFEVYAQRNEIQPAEKDEARHQFFSKSQACMRSSPLGKRHGWGIHSNADGKMAVYAVESEEYRRLANDPTIEHTKAMRSKRA